MGSSTHSEDDYWRVLFRCLERGAVTLVGGTQKVRFCAASDGARIAYAIHGRGSPLVRTPTWLTHLEFDWQSPVWRHWLVGLG